MTVSPDLRPFSRFLASFRPDYGAAIQNVAAPFGISEYFEALGGRSFNRGIFRVISKADLGEWRNRLSVAFPSFTTRALPFAFKWSGDVFALDSARTIGDAPGVLLFEIGTAQVLEIPCNLTTFHDEELIDDSEASLSFNFFQDWLRSGGASPKSPECVGYKLPLFLGGKDVVQNLELGDLDVYWNVVGEVVAKSIESR